MAGAEVRRARSRGRFRRRGGLAAGLLSLALCLGAAGRAPTPDDGELERRWTAFRAAYQSYTRDDPAERRAGELALIEVAPALFDALAAEPAVPADKASFALQALLVVFSTAAGDARTAIEENRIGKRMNTLALALGDPALGGQIAYWVGFVQMNRGLLGEADDALSAAVETYTTPTEVTPRLHLLRADIRRTTGRWEEAQRCLDAADAAIAAMGWKPGSYELMEARAAHLGFQGQLEIARGLPDLAMTAFEEESALAARLAGEPWGNTFALGNAAARRMELYLLLERYEKILADAPPVLELDIDPHARALIELQLAMALAKLEDRDPARERTAGARLEELVRAGRMDVIAGARAEMQLAEIALGEERYADARTWLDASGARLAETEEAPEHVLELAFQRALEARLARLSAAPAEALETRLEALLAAYDSLLDTWSAQPLTPGGIGFLQVNQRRVVVGEVIAACLAVDGRGPEAAVEQALRAQANGTLSRRLGARAPSLAEIRATLLADGSGLLLYQQTGFESHLLAVDAEGVVPATLPPMHVIDELYFDLRDLVATDPGHSRGVTAEERERDLADVDAFARALGNALLPPEIRRRVQGWRHVIVSDGSQIGDVPWECLPLANGEPLGLAKPLSHLPSVPLGVHLARRERAREPRYDLLLFAMPPPGAAAVALEPRLGPLPLAPETLQRMTGAFPADRVRTWPGEQATHTALAEAPLGEAAILNLFCHGLYDPSRERPAALVLAADGAATGLVECEDVERLAGRVPALVVLAACGAARGHRRAGEDGGTHLGGAFLYAGADAVVLASASVEYAATVALVEVFHRELAAGRDVAHALREARRAVARTQPHPYYHSLLRAIGLGASTPFRER